MTHHQQALLEFMAWMCAMGCIGLSLYSMRHKIEREQQWRKIK